MYDECFCDWKTNNGTCAGLVFPKYTHGIFAGVGDFDLDFISWHPDLDERKGGSLSLIHIFGETTNLTSILLPSKLICIDGQAFKGCAIRSISLPNGLTQIDVYKRQD